MSLQIKCELILPHWLESFVDDWPDPLETVQQRMLLAVSLSAENVRHGTGGPFGAIVVEDKTSRLMGVGVNLVTTVELSIAHAEMVAISLAQSAINNWNLGHESDVQLVTSCEPCAGDKPANWVHSLEIRGIRTQADVLRKEAAAVLQKYARKAGAIYHPGQL